MHLRTIAAAAIAIATVTASSSAGAGPPAGDAVVVMDAPPVARVRVEVGWSTTTAEALAELRGEARVGRRVSLIAGAHARRDDAGARPILGGAAQLLARDDRAVRAQVVYRPEGMVEPEGEVEASVIGSLLAGPGWLALAATYGQDPEGHERDVEGLVGYQGLTRAGVTVGALVRGRRALGSKLEHQRVWDALATGLVSAGRGPWSVALAAGVEHVGREATSETGAQATLAVAATW